MQADGVTLDRAALRLPFSALNITLPQNKSLQLWLIRGSAPPRSLGLITHPDHNVFPLPPGTLDHQTALAISL
ncbi:anti-sigma-K factor RskA [Pantoea anthophila]|nr:anti-sigma-K factor RskA [Pantoea anthophila]